MPEMRFAGAGGRGVLPELRHSDGWWTAIRDSSRPGAAGPVSDIGPAHAACATGAFGDDGPTGAAHPAIAGVRAVSAFRAGWCRARSGASGVHSGIVHPLFG